MPYSIRPATLADSPILPALEMDAGEAFRAHGLADIADDEPWDEDFYDDPVERGRVWVATDDGADGPDAIVGFIAMGVRDKRAYVGEISVRFAHARQGLGRRLMETGLAWAQDQGFTEAVLTTFRDLPFNAPFYRSFGFVEFTPGPDHPELAAARQEEQASGIELKPRIAMLLRLPVAS